MLWNLICIDGAAGLLSFSDSVICKQLQLNEFLCKVEHLISGDVNCLHNLNFMNRVIFRLKYSTLTFYRAYSSEITNEFKNMRFAR